MEERVESDIKGVKGLKARESERERGWAVIRPARVFKGYNGEVAVAKRKKETRKAGQSGEREREEDKGRNSPIAAIGEEYKGAEIPERPSKWHVVWRTLRLANPASVSTYLSPSLSRGHFLSFRKATKILLRVPGHLDNSCRKTTRNPIALDPAKSTKVPICISSLRNLRIQ
jgi:hypothetical protein